MAHEEGNFATATHYLHHEIQPIIDRHYVADPTLYAHLFLQLADSAVAHGERQTGIGYVQQALTVYNTQSNRYGQLLGWLWLARTSLEVGDYAEAERQLQNARRQLTPGNLGSLAQAHFLYVQLLLHWHQHQLTEAIQTAEHYLTLIDAEPTGNRQVDARLMLGNLYRDAGQFHVAHSWYTETSQAIEQLGYQSSLAELDAELAWLYLLEGRLSYSRALIGEQLKHTDPKPTMKLQVVLAVLQMLDGEWTSAYEHLQQALVFYEETGDQVAGCAVHLYLAYNALHRDHPTEVLFHLERTFGWLAARGLTTFPYWWHPKIVAEVCTYALISDLYAELAEQILMKHVGKAALPALQLLEKTVDIDLRRKAFRLQQIINGLTTEPLSHLRATHSRQVLQTLLEQGILRMEMYSTLERELMTARRRRNPNPTIIAVFGLYVNGVERSEIAKQLKCSLENVRNYITTIYQLFGLPSQQFRGRESRKQKLIEMARMRGFIY